MAKPYKHFLPCLLLLHHLRHSTSKKERLQRVCIRINKTSEDAAHQNRFVRSILTRELQNDAAAE